MFVLPANDRGKNSGTLWFLAVKRSLYSITQVNKQHKLSAVVRYVVKRNNEHSVVINTLKTNKITPVGTCENNWERKENYTEKE